eukprot:12913391-Prorocentrum_lima.AAC.1
MLLQRLPWFRWIIKLSNIRRIKSSDSLDQNGFSERTPTFVEGVMIAQKWLTSKGRHANAGGGSPSQFVRGRSGPNMQH